MTTRLDATAPDFPARFEALVQSRREAEDDVRDQVAAIIGAVRRDGDAALVELTARLDRLALTPERLRIGAEEFAAATALVEPETLQALTLAAGRIRAFHERLLPEPVRHRDPLGVELGQIWTAIDAVGLYVPGGTAAYPSSVLMNAIPAKVAGCRRLVMVVPTPDGITNPLVLAAAKLAGVDEVYRIGGAQAVAALAYGTATIAPVDKIVGPGNAYVAEAKRQVFGRVGIDMIAGPSEVVVVADTSADPSWIAADLLAQAEHDERAQAILVTDDRDLAIRVEAEVARQLATLERRAIAAASWERHGALITVPSLAAALPVIDALAPEHLELAIRDPAPFAARVRHAGAIFLGALTPEVIGDYVGGPNHVLPTSRTARFASGLSVHDFLKRTTVLGCDATSFQALGPAAARLARAEGLGAHARAIELRLAGSGLG
jgi:histidinol dehydrogenase